MSLIFLPLTVPNLGVVGSQSRAISMVSVNAGGASGVKGFEVNASEGVTTVKVLKYNVRRLRETGTRTLHELIHAPMTTYSTSLGNNPRRAKNGIKEGDQGLDGRVMASGMQPHTVGTVDKVAGRGFDDGSRSCGGVGRWVAGMADHIRAIARDGWN